MKKLVSKAKQSLQKISGKGHKKPLEEPVGRITTDTLAEHREKVLAGGRKFKYPMQYAKYKLVINAIIISVGALLLLLGVGWYLLYKAQDTSEFMYHVTSVVPVPVAVIDGQQVRYSDYLMKYRSAVHYLVDKEQVDISTKDGKSQDAFIRSKSLSDAIADAYAAKLAKGLNLTVSDADFQVFLKQQRQSSDGEVSEATYDAVIKDYYDWSPSEYSDAMKSKLLRQKVSYAIDTDAESVAKNIEAKLSSGSTDLAAIASDLNAQAADTVTYSPEAWVPRNNQDGGLAAAAAKLKQGQVSAAIKTTSGNGYYYVKLINSTDSQVQYAYIQVPLKAFDAQLKNVEKQGKLTKFIPVEDITTQE